MEEVKKASLKEGDILSARILRNRTEEARKNAELSLSSFIENRKEILLHIEAIVRKPLMKSQAEDTLVRSETSGALTPEAFLLTLRDTPLWKEKEGYGMAPEYVHAIRYEDSINLYENLVIIRAITLLQQEVKGALKGAQKEVSSVQSSYQREEAIFGSSSFFLDLATHSAKLGRGLVERYQANKKEEEIRRLLRRISAIKHSRFYQFLEKEKIPTSFIPTNILLHHPLYREVFTYVMNHQSQHTSSPFLRDIRFLLAFDRVLKSKMRSKATMNVTIKEGKAILIPFSFSRNGVQIHMSQEEEILLFSCSYKGFTSMHAIDLEGKEDPRYPSAYCLYEKGKGSEENAFILKDEEGMEDQIVSFLNSMTTLIPFHQETLTRCPVCGTSISPLRQGEEASCSHCQSRYVYCNAQGKAGEIWVKSFWGR